MKQSALKLILIGIWVALLVLAAIPGGARQIAAAPLAVVTATEPPTRTPTSAPTKTPGPLPTAKPVATHRPDTGIADPVITKAAYGWNDGSGYSINVSNLPPQDADPFAARREQIRKAHLRKAGVAT